ncbi:uncharacterized protein B0I36DRAFT_348738 [Microdochium trichocladiopsis]|uniref:Uncharacterized protein n=1 Tax=Microdochium trichocladiopsis TaxID=1682393 RepID=A0A9P8YAG4_9PEZI|nr:uncharacterized protein B0I36DRAFT_348738 [Microdochium trichocladiopsis]KAH7033725.1 hypothetical protein B0I36DRAFT_348738 [Microdochium trichocladiopsis]
MAALDRAPRVRKFAASSREEAIPRTRLQDTPVTAPAANLGIGAIRDISPIAVRENGYNPESVLSSLISLEAHGGEQIRRRPQSRMAWYQRHKAKRQTESRPMTAAHRAYLDEIRAMGDVPQQTVAALLPLYITMLDDLIPLLDGPQLFRDWSNGTASCFLVNAVCLVVCKSPQAAPFLHLDTPAPGLPIAAPSDQARAAPLSALEFASRLFLALDAAMKADLEPDRTGPGVWIGP